jgi:hypothetical protein
MAFEEIEPDPAGVSMRLLAQLLTLMANQFHRPAKPYEVADFLPWTQEHEEVVAANESWNDALAEMRAAYAQRQGRH